MLIPPQGEPMENQADIAEMLLKQLITVAYPEFEKWMVSLVYRQSSSFAQISWDEAAKRASMLCDKSTGTWPKVALTGLLAHELSHPSAKKPTEEQTDLDVIQRGLGVYLAVERVYCGKYEDHKVSRGKDRYLGYRSIREMLTSNETLQLDRVLEKLNLIPTLKKGSSKPIHDVVICSDYKQSYVKLAGHEFPFSKHIINPNIELKLIDGALHVLVNNQEIGRIVEY
jgi:hypothetical protein